MKRYLLAALMSFAITSAVVAQDATHASVAAGRTKTLINDKEIEDRLQRSNKVFKESVDTQKTINTGSKLPVTDLPTVQVNKIIITDSIVLDNGELNSLAAFYENRFLTANEIKELVEKINQLYFEKEIFTARAFVGPQSLNNGVLTIKLVEATIGFVEYNGQKSTSEVFLRNVLDFKSGDFANNKDLEKKLLKFNLVYDLNITAALAPGKELGTTDYRLHVSEPKHIESTFFIDNAGREETGLLRLGALWVNRSLFGRRDSLTIGSVLSEKTWDLFSSYSLSIHKSGTNISIDADISGSKVEHGVLEGLDVKGAFYNLGLCLRQPFVYKENTLMHLYLKYNRKKSSTKVDGFDTFDTRISEATFGFDYAFFSTWGYIYVDNSLVRGFDEMGGMRNFNLYKTEIDSQIVTSSKTRFNFRFKQQLSDTALLPSSEQFQIGGVSTVRGYPEGMLIGDNGYFFNLEFSFPLAENNALKRIKPFIFFDHGQIYKYKARAKSGLNHSEISGCGFGFDLSLFENMSLRAILGIPLNSHQFNDTDYPTAHVYFQYSF